VQDHLNSIIFSESEVAVTEDYIWDNSNRGGMKDILVLQRTSAGTGFLKKKEERVTVGPGQAMLFIHGEDSSYGYAPKSAGPYVFSYLSFKGVHLKALFERLTEQFGSIVEIPDVSETFLLFETILNKYQARAFRDQYEVSILLYELVMSLYRSQVDISRERDCSVVAWNWIHHRFDQPFNMKELAARLGVSREHLTRKFKQSYGVAPAEMLRNLRLERGRVLTMSTRLTLDDLARQSGYRDGNIFCRAYRNKFGTSPMQDRKES